MAKAKKHKSLTLSDFLENDESVTWADDGTCRWTHNGCNYVAAPRQLDGKGFIPVWRMDSEGKYVLERGRAKPDMKMGKLYSSMYLLNIG